MVKYKKFHIALIGKSILSEATESLGHRLQAQTVKDWGKCVRERFSQK